MNRKRRLAQNINNEHHQIVMQSINSISVSIPSFTFIYEFDSISILAL